MPAKPGYKPLKKLKPGMGLYQVLYWPNVAPDKSKPWAVVNLQTGDVNGRWHASKEEALVQARALYSQLGDKAKVHGEEVHNAFYLFADAATLVSDDGVKWIEAIAPKTYTTPAYGDVEITPEKINAFAHGINTMIRGQDVAINYEHGADPSKGLKAAGWIKQARTNSRGNLELAVDFTEPAKQEIKNGEWKYFSLEWDDQWLHPDGVIYTDVVMGGALTNRPVAKGLMPINFSEIFKEKLEELGELPNGNNISNNTLGTEAFVDNAFAVWDTAYVNNLPDSSFAYIEPGGKKGSDGKTEPRSLRHFPYKDASGNVDLAHVRNMIARAPQANVPDNIKARVQALGRRLLGAKNMSDVAQIEKEFSEEGPLEHSQPGSGSPPIPRLIDSGIDDADRVNGWRIETPPYNNPPQVGQLYEVPANGEVIIGFSEEEALGYLTGAVTGLKNIHTNRGDQLIEDIDRLMAVDRRVRSFNELQRLVKEVRDYLRNNKAMTDGTKLSEITTSNNGGGKSVGELTDKDLLELRNVLGVDDDGRIVEAVKTKFGELHALRDSVSASEQERIFAEQYPQFYAEHLKLVEDQRKTSATKFSESVSKIKKAEGFGLKTTKQGLSTACIEKLEETYLKFSEGKGTISDFEECIRAIVNGGIVTFGEIGTSEGDEIPDIDTTGPLGISNARRAFADVVAKVMKDNPDMDQRVAFAEAAKKAPDLAEAYKVTLPA